MNSAPAFEIVAGDVVVADAPPPLRCRRTVVVTRIDGDRLWCLLVCPRVGDATDLDLIATVNGEALVVQAELYLAVHTHQVAARVGRISSAELAAVTRSLRTGGASLTGHRTGRPLGGVNDRRRQHKQLELDDAMMLRRHLYQQLAC